MASILDDLASTKINVFSQGDKLSESIILRVGTKVYDAWESIELERSIENVSSGFKVSFSDRWRDSLEEWPLVPGKPLRVNIGDIAVVNGFIDGLSVSVDGDSRKMDITGRDKVSDIIDCSAFGSNELKDVSIEDIAIKYAYELFGIKVIVETDIGENFKVWTTNQGETVFETLQRAAKQRGVMLQSNEDGDLVITNRSSKKAELPSNQNLQASFDFVASAASEAGTDTSEVSLIQGENVLEASANYDLTDRYSDYLIKGQGPSIDGFSGKKANQIEATAKDIGMPRFRPLMIITDGNIDQAGAKKRANWEASTRAAKSMQVSVKVQGWLEKPGGKLWRPNTLCRVEIPFIGIKGTLLISSVLYSKGADGTFTDITLVRSDAFSPDLDEIAKKGADDGLGWLRKLS